MDSGQKGPGTFPGPKVVVTVDDRERQSEVLQEEAQPYGRASTGIVRCGIYRCL